jgi:hypothetical protein
MLVCYFISFFCLRNLSQLNLYQEKLSQENLSLLDPCSFVKQNYQKNLLDKLSSPFITQMNKLTYINEYKSIYDDIKYTHNLWKNLHIDDF